MKARGLTLRWGLEGEPGLAEESGDEDGLALDAAEPTADNGGELVDGGGGQVAQAGFHAGPGALSRFVTVQGSLGGRLRAFRLSAGRGCSGWWSGPSGCGQVIRGRAGRRRRCGRGNCLQMMAKEIPETALWASFPEANRNEVLGLLSMVLERLAAGAAEGAGGEHGSAA